MVSQTMLNGLGTQQLTVSNTSVAMTVPTSAQRALIFVDVDDVYMEVDDTDATTSNQLVVAGTTINLTDARYKLSRFRFIRRTNDATLHISYYS